MDEDTLKYKRQVRDYYNKWVEDKKVIDNVAKAIGFPNARAKKIIWKNIFVWKNIK